METQIITPKTKIYDLLEAYPHLEELLIEMAPPFKKLKNPVLRKTIARVTTLAQAAAIGNRNVEELVIQLRKAAGQDLVSVEAGGEVHVTTTQPDWFRAAAISEMIDIRDMLHQGEQPVHVVLSALKKLGSGGILKIIAPFLPAPLIEKAASLGFAHWVDKQADDFFIVYFQQK
ncbi:MAG TPA: DUF1858 domain-containing protein [Prolixibacteraceae bacterium]|nr:DUF1858 domain-containing protein [Prolixibacteraceae bacterium]